jgi:uncharacterized protein YecT (DUF1311 family)
MPIKIFLIPLLLVFSQIPLKAHDHTFESWNAKQWEDYPFECVETGATPEYTRCYAEKANKRDWDLRQELNDDKLWKDWMSARRRICHHYKSKHFGQGTVKPLMVISCEMRLNSEAKRFCLSGEDKQCG